MGFLTGLLLFFSSLSGFLPGLGEEIFVSLLSRRVFMLSQPLFLVAGFLFFQSPKKKKPIYPFMHKCLITVQLQVHVPCTDTLLPDISASCPLAGVHIVRVCHQSLVYPTLPESFLSLKLANWLGGN